MNEEMNTTMPVEETPVAEPVLDIKKIIEDLKAQGLGVEEIIAALEKLVADGKLTEEELAQAKEELLAEDKKNASELFGVDIM